MPDDIVQKLAMEAARDGITLRWAILHLAQLLASDDFPRGTPDAMTARIQREALGVVLLAARGAFSADDDTPTPETHT